MGGLALKFACLGFGFVLIMIGSVLMGVGYNKKHQLKKEKMSHQVQSLESVLDANYTNTTCYNGSDSSFI